MQIHELKIKKEFAKAIFNKKKSFEIRKNDRSFKVGDFIRFIVINDNGNKITYATDEYLYRVDYILSPNDFPEGIKKDYVVFSFSRYALTKCK